LIHGGLHSQGACSVTTHPHTHTHMRAHAHTNTDTQVYTHRHMHTNIHRKHEKGTERSDLFGCHGLQGRRTVPSPQHSHTDHDIVSQMSHLDRGPKQNRHKCHSA